MTAAGRAANWPFDKHFNGGGKKGQLYIHHTFYSLKVFLFLEESSSLLTIV